MSAFVVISHVNPTRFLALAFGIKVALNIYTHAAFLRTTSEGDA